MAMRNQHRGSRYQGERVEVLGSVYAKQPFIGQFGSEVSGVQGATLGTLKYLPAFVIPKRYWMSVKMVGNADVSIAQWMNYSLFGDHVPYTHDLSTDVPRTTIENDFAELTDEAYGQRIDRSENDTGDLELGLGDDERIIALPGRFFRRTAQTLGLPGKAVFSADGKIRYVDEFTTKGNIPMGERNFHEGGLLGWTWAAGADVATANDDKEGALWGGTTGSSGSGTLDSDVANALFQTLVRAVSSDDYFDPGGDFSQNLQQAASPASTVASISSSGLGKWLESNYGQGSNLGDEVRLDYYGRITYQFDVLRPYDATRTVRLKSAGGLLNVGTFPVFGGC